MWKKHHQCQCSFMYHRAHSHVGEGSPKDPIIHKYIQQYPKIIIRGIYWVFYALLKNMYLIDVRVTSMWMARSPQLSAGCD